MMNGHRGYGEKRVVVAACRTTTISMLHREQGAGSEIKILIGRATAMPILDQTNRRPRALE
jgi:hypothetical protein